MLVWREVVGPDKSGCQGEPDRGFKGKQPALGVEAAAISGQLVRRADNSVARDDERQGVRAVRRADRPAGRGVSRQRGAMSW